MGFEQQVAALAVAYESSELYGNVARRKFAEFVASRPEEFRPLYIGPIPALANSYVTYGLMSSGSRYGYETYYDHQLEMAAFCEHFRDADVVCLEFGADYKGMDGALSAMYGEHFKPKSED